ncbi:hypothetical protein GALMADRAFT_483487 [Galerina marginata CBS 339.88]|uniref:Uncharacterized protein n=1 Tax=Galerina marginata (strain CBS 339.88) TaxID=685588 RepID=A0A067SX36_GALM3|nr:hypothetical protein GALMADRAFT_483487 [Galerina marginata CBS 339.88]
MSGVILWLWSKTVTRVLYHPIIWLRNQFFNNGQHDDKRKWLLPLEDILVVWNKKTWIEFDLAWLDVRDNYLTTGQGIHAATTFPLHVPLYDIVSGLGTAIKEHGVEDSVTFVPTVYHCFQEIAQNTHDIHHWQYPYQRHLQALVKRFLKRGTFGYISDVVDGENADLLFDENNLAFLTVMINNRNLEEIVPRTTHFHELQLRVLAFFTVFPMKLLKEPSGQNFPYVIKFDHPGMVTDWGKPALEDFAIQWASIFYMFFKALTNDFIPEKVLVQSFHAHGISKDFIWGGITRLKHIHEAKIDSTLVADCLVATINVCTTTLNTHMADLESTRRPDLLFSAASSFASYMQSQSWIPDSVYTALSQLGPVLIRYGQVVDDLEKNHGQSRMKYVSPQDARDTDADTVSAFGSSEAESG